MNYEQFAGAACRYSAKAEQSEHAS